MRGWATAISEEIPQAEGQETTENLGRCLPSVGETTGAGELCGATASRATGLCSGDLLLTNPDSPPQTICRQNPGQPSRAPPAPRNPSGPTSGQPWISAPGHELLPVPRGLLARSLKVGGEVSPPLQKWSEGAGRVGGGPGVHARSLRCRPSWGWEGEVHALGWVPQDSMSLRKQGSRWPEQHKEIGYWSYSAL